MKRRKISEIAKEMFEIINQRPTDKELKELSKVLSNSDCSEEKDNDSRFLDEYHD